MRLLMAMIALLLVVTAALAGSDDPLMKGKQRTGREIVLEAVLDAPPETVYQLWATPEGVRSFLAPEASADATRSCSRPRPTRKANRQAPRVPVSSRWTRDARSPSNGGEPAT